MGREIQKKKNRSGLQKIRQKPKSKKKLLQNPIIAANWDKNETLTQNYRRLGLASKLNKTTGGVEKKVSDILRQVDGEYVPKKDDSLSVQSAKKPEHIDITETRVERDPKTGKILRVVTEERSSKANPLNDPLNELDSDSEDEQPTWASLENQHGNVDATTASLPSTSTKTDVVRQLEERASRPAAAYKRRQTENEIAFIEQLVRKYGDNYPKMARDMKINYMQRTEGDLKRRIKIWKENGGTVH